MIGLLLRIKSKHGDSIMKAVGEEVSRKFLVAYGNASYVISVT